MLDQHFTIPDLLSPPSRGAIWNAATPEDLDKRMLEIADECEQIVKTCDAENRDLTREEAAHLDSNFTKFKALQQQAGLLEHQGQAGGLRVGTGRKSTPWGPEDSGPRRQTVSLGDALEDKTFSAKLQFLQRTPGLNGRRFADLFGAAQREREPGFKSFNEFLEIIHENKYDPRLIKAAGMSEQSGYEGGYLVPMQYSSELLDAALESEIVRPRARVEPMTSSHKLIGTLTNSDNSTSAPYGGLSLQWTAEKGTISTKQAKTHLVTLHAHKGAILVPISNELLGDSNVEQLLSTALIQSVSWGMDAAFLTGSGAGQPLGVLNAPSLVSIAKESGQLADTLNYLNIVKMYGSLHPSCVANSVWVCNSTCVPQLLTMNAAETAASAFIPAVTQSGGQFTLLGRPVLFTEKLPVLGDQGDILLADFSQYIIGLRKEITIDSDRGVGGGFVTDETYLRTIVRVDGVPAWASSVSPKNGSAQSWAVVLDARA